MSRTISRPKREGGISLKTPQWKRASSHVEGRISCFFSSCGRNLGVPLELRLGPQGPNRVASGKSSLHASCEGPLGIPLQSLPGPMSSLEMRLERQGSSQRLTCISSFLWSFNRGVRSHLVWRQASPLSSRAVTAVSGFLSSGHKDVAFTKCATWL